MKRLKSVRNITMFAAAVAATLTVGTAAAARPATVGDTTWDLQTNLGTFQLVITNHGGSGAPGATTCRNIYGDLGEINNISGWYCPLTGRIHFVHRNLGTNNPVRVFFGNVNGDALGVPVSIIGGMTVLIPEFGDLGEYNFTGTPAP